MFVKAALVAMILSMAAQAQQLRLTVGTNPDGAPMSFHDSNSGRYRGVSVDLLAEIAKDAGFQVEYAPMPLAELIPALNDHRIDVIAANLLATPQRRALIDFSETYHSGGDALVVPKSDPREYKSIADLKGMVIGAQKGSAQLAAIQSTGLFSDIKVFDNIDAVMREVSAGRIAAGIVGGTSAHYQLHLGKFADLRLVAAYQPTLVSGIGFGVRKSDGELLQKINRSLARLQADGTLRKILSSYGLQPHLVRSASVDS
jgi:polar amino acid transport system substrate-binding protein